MLSLNDRYHLDENIRCGKYLIPVAVNDVLCRVRYCQLDKSVMVIEKHKIKKRRTNDLSVPNQMWT